MTTTLQNNILPTDGTAASQDNEQMEVEIWGPPGNGKTVLLVSLVETQLKMSQMFNFQMTPLLLKKRTALRRGDPPEITLTAAELEQLKQEGEWLTFEMPTEKYGKRRVRVTSNAGDDLLTRDGGIDVKKFIAQREGKVFVACLNPFKLDDEIAAKGLNHLISVLQGANQDRDLPAAFELAVWNLFQISPDTINRRANLKALLGRWRDTRIIYDPIHKKFNWNKIDDGSREELNAEMKRLIDDVIEDQRLLVNILQQAMDKLENSAVVLTHVDLIDELLPSITFTDLERVYSNLYAKRAERMVCQQAVARLFHIELDNPFSSTAAPQGVSWDSRNDSAAPDKLAPVSATDSKITPQPYAWRGITQRLRNDGAIQLVRYLQAVASRGAEPTTIQVDRLRLQLETATRELQSVEQKKQALTTQLEEEKVARSRTDADATKLSTDLEQARIKLLQLDQQDAAPLTELIATQNALAQAQVKIGELTRVAGSVQNCPSCGRLRDSIDDLHARLESKERELHGWEERVQTDPELPESEKRARRVYEEHRMGSFKTWTLFMLRALPVLPFAVALLCLIDRPSGTSVAQGFKDRFWLDSILTALGVGLVSFGSLWLQFAQLPPRWIWLRSMNMKNPRTMETLTSGGEKLELLPTRLTLERSPLLQLLGIGTILRTDNKQRYVTTEPDSWLAAPERPSTRWVFLLDFLTLILCAAWVVALIVLMYK